MKSLPSRTGFALRVRAATRFSKLMPLLEALVHRNGREMFRLVMFSPLADQTRFKQETAAKNTPHGKRVAPNSRLIMK